MTTIKCWNDKEEYASFFELRPNQEIYCINGGWDGTIQFFSDGSCCVTNVVSSVKYQNYKEVSNLTS